MSTIEITETEFQQHVNELAQQIRRDVEKATAIVGVARGGLVPATYLSYKLNLPLATTFYSSAKGNGKSQTGASAVDFAALDSTAKYVIVVDDICDTGNTMTEIVAELERRGVQSYTAVIVEKPHTTFSCDAVAFRVDEQQEDRWIIFPWEDGRVV